MIAPALLACGQEEVTIVEEGALSSVAQPIIGLELRGDLPACGGENASDVYYVRSEAQVYYCDGRQLRTLELEVEPGWLTDSITAPASVCAGGGVIIRSGPDLDRDQRLSQQEISGSSALCTDANEAAAGVGEPGSAAMGLPGEDGAEGPQGPVGLQGPVGPAGPAAPAGAEPDGPVPHVGDFQLEIEGLDGAIPLMSFAGCFDELVGVLYHDCYFQVVGLPAPVLSWLAESLSGSQLRRDLTVRELDGANAVLAQLQIDAAWIRELRVSDFDDGASSAGTLRFVVVPQLLASVAPSAPAAAASAPVFSQGDFSIAIPGVDAAGIVALSGLQLSRDRLAGTGPDPERTYFAPGELLFDELTLVAAQSRSAATLADLNSWVAELDGSGGDRRDAVLSILGGSTPIAQLHLQQLLPTTGLTLIGERRSLSLRVESFDLVAVP